MKLLLSKLLVISRTNQRSLTFLNFPGEVSPVGNNVSHTPLFFKEVLETFQPQPHHRFMDMTFGTGGHSNLLLDSCKKAVVVAADRDPNSVDLAKRMSVKHDNLIPILARFSELPIHLSAFGFTANCFDGVIIDAGISDIQWADQTRGFCWNKKGPLDLRMDAERFPKHPTASDVLQNIDEDSLVKVLRRYGDMNQHARLVTGAIIEARYMFHHFLTVQELKDVIRDAVAVSGSYVQRDDDQENKMTEVLLAKTMTALRMFVNDEINELEYAIRIASHFLKQEGTILIIIHNHAQEKVIRKGLMEVDYDPQFNSDPMLLMHTPWKVLTSPPLTLSKPDRLLHPRHDNAKMYIAKKQREMLTLAATA